MCPIWSTEDDLEIRIDKRGGIDFSYHFGLFRLLITVGYLITFEMANLDGV